MKYIATTLAAYMAGVAAQNITLPPTIMTTDNGMGVMESFCLDPTVPASTAPRWETR